MCICDVNYEVYKHVFVFSFSLFLFFNQLDFLYNYICELKFKVIKILDD